MSEFMEDIGAIVEGASTGTADVEHAIGFGWSGSIADNAAFTFTITAQTAIRPERMELSVSPDTGMAGIVIEALTIGGENQLASADKLGAIMFHKQAPIMDTQWDEWPAGTPLTLTVRNRSGAAAFVTGVMFGELLGT